MLTTVTDLQWKQIVVGGIAPHVVSTGLLIITIVAYTFFLVFQTGGEPDPGALQQFNTVSGTQIYPVVTILLTVVAAGWVARRVDPDSEKGVTSVLEIQTDYPDEFVQETKNWFSSSTTVLHSDDETVVVMLEGQPPNGYFVSEDIEYHPTTPVVARDGYLFISVVDSNERDDCTNRESVSSSFLLYYNPYTRNKFVMQQNTPTTSPFKYYLILSF